MTLIKIIWYTLLSVFLSVALIIVRTCSGVRIFPKNMSTEKRTDVLVEILVIAFTIAIVAFFASLVVR